MGSSRSQHPLRVETGQVRQTRACSETDALYREHGDFVIRLCQLLLRNRLEAEDAAQQAFLSAHRALLNGVAARDPKAWLAAIARNECRNRRSTVTPMNTHESDDVENRDAIAEVVGRQELAALWAEVALMTPLQRNAYLLREVRGLSYSEVAAELALSSSSVRSLLLRARARLRSRIRALSVAITGTPLPQLLVRVVVGEASPIPAATKVAAVGLGATAVLSVGAMPRHHHLGSISPQPASHVLVHVPAVRAQAARPKAFGTSENARLSRPKLVAHFDERRGSGLTTESSRDDRVSDGHDERADGSSQASALVAKQSSRGDGSRTSTDGSTASTASEDLSSLEDGETPTESGSPTPSEDGSQTPTTTSSDGDGTASPEASGQTGGVFSGSDGKSGGDDSPDGHVTDDSNDGGSWR